MLDVNNDAFHQRAKSRIKIIHVLGYTKITKSDIFGRVEILHCSLLSNVRLVIFTRHKI